MIRTLCIALIALFVFTGCMKDNECLFDECAHKAPASEEQSVKDYLISKGITAQRHCSGLYYAIDTLGTGRAPNSCARVEVIYSGKFTNDNPLDAGHTAFNLDAVIRAWQIGVPLIKEGGRIRLYVPPAHGYGTKEIKDPNTGQVVVPGNSILIFDISLISIQ